MECGGAYFIIARFGSGSCPFTVCNYLPWRFQKAHIMMPRLQDNSSESKGGQMDISGLQLYDVMSPCLAFWFIVSLFRSLDGRSTLCGFAQATGQPTWVSKLWTIAIVLPRQCPLHWCRPRRLPAITQDFPLGIYALMHNFLMHLCGLDRWNDKKDCPSIRPVHRF